MAEPAVAKLRTVARPDAATARIRFVTAASLFDGHDAAINIMRRLIQAQGVEVIHLGHNRSVEDVVRAALQEDADGIALSSYQGGHMEFFRYLSARLREQGFTDQPGEQTKAKLEELKFLVSSIGPTGLLALKPFLRMSRKDLWQFYMLSS